MPSRGLLPITTDCSFSLSLSLPSATVSCVCELCSAFAVLFELPQQLMDVMLLFEFEPFFYYRLASAKVVLGASVRQIVLNRLCVQLR